MSHAQEERPSLFRPRQRTGFANLLCPGKAPRRERSFCHVTRLVLPPLPRGFQNCGTGHETKGIGHRSKDEIFGGLGSTNETWAAWADSLCHATPFTLRPRLFRGRPWNCGTCALPHLLGAGLGLAALAHCSTSSGAVLVIGAQAPFPTSGGGPLTRGACALSTFLWAGLGPEAHAQFPPSPERASDPRHMRTALSSLGRGLRMIRPFCFLS